MSGRQHARQDAKVDGVHVNIGLPHLTLIPPRNRAPRTRTEIDLVNPCRSAIALVGQPCGFTSNSPRPGPMPSVLNWRVRSQYFAIASTQLASTSLLLRPRAKPWRSCNRISSHSRKRTPV